MVRPLPPYAVFCFYDPIFIAGFKSVCRADEFYAAETNDGLSQPNVICIAKFTIKSIEILSSKKNRQPGCLFFIREEMIVSILLLYCVQRRLCPGSPWVHIHND